ncbi:hypothetical protein DSC45_13675 [Streptomyces sp. YIM 130001]|uniref:hypothetical protein n=1 Tax=Streptomyces sp. YIM 130001 TaxID=2259644 RepID=UPI000E648A80|nr:hypothetical protein [Streptomyces sp. YIM 130001]RII17208.1 hypothetical protein DSC45_13675 [Streptomyces sp. YIM 130001]
MKRSRIGIGAALTAGALATAGLIYAPAAAAVEPGTATVQADCGIYGGGEATLTATQDGTTATITVTSSEITTPVAVDANTVDTTITMTKGGGGTTEFTGSSNPAMEAGGGVDSGPLTGTVASGDSLDAFPGSLTLVVMGISVTCESTAAQSPGPFVFD